MQAAGGGREGGVVVVVVVVIQSLIHSILSKNIHNCDELSGTTHRACQSLNLNYDPQYYQL